MVITMTERHRGDLPQQITLQWETWQMAEIIPREALLNTEIETILDPVLGNFMITMKKKILADTFADEKHRVAVWVPASPWQMFKDRHSNSWWMRLLPAHRRKIKKTTMWSEVRIHRMHFYPQARLPYEKFGPAYVYEIVTSRQVNLP